MQATSVALMFHQSGKPTPTTGLAHCFPLPLALTAQHRHSSLCFPSQRTRGTEWYLVSIYFLCFYSFQWMILFFFSLFFKSAWTHSRLHAFVLSCFVFFFTVFEESQLHWEAWEVWVECFDLIHPCLSFLLTNQLISVGSGGRVLGCTGKWSSRGARLVWGWWSLTVQWDQKGRTLECLLQVQGDDR